MAELLTMAQERILIKLAQNGDREAMNHILASNIGLVKKIAYKMCSETVEADDLIQVGYMGLIRAVEKFDLSKQVKLVTYSYRWISEYMVRYIQNYSRAIRIPVPKFRNNYSTMVQSMILEQKLGETPTPEELAEFTGKSIKQIDKYNKEMVSTVSLNAIVPGNENEVQLLDIIPNEIELGLHEKIATTEMLELIKTILTEKNYEIFAKRIGLTDKPKSFNLIGIENGKTPQAVQQMYRNSILKLQRNSKIKMFNVS